MENVLIGMKYYPYIYYALKCVVCELYKYRIVNQLLYIMIFSVQLLVML